MLSPPVMPIDLQAAQTILRTASNNLEDPKQAVMRPIYDSSLPEHQSLDGAVYNQVDPIGAPHPERVVRPTVLLANGRLTMNIPGKYVPPSAEETDPTEMFLPTYTYSHDLSSSGIDEFDDVEDEDEDAESLDEEDTGVLRLDHPKPARK